MKDGAKWYPRYPLTFLGGVQGLSAREIAVYTVTLDLIYQHGGRINNDPKWISGWFRDLGADAVRRSLAALVERGLLTDEGATISNKLALVYAKPSENFGKTSSKLRVNFGETSSKLRKNSGKNDEVLGLGSSENKDIAVEGQKKNDAAYKSREEDLPSDTSYPQSDLIGPAGAVPHPVDDAGAAGAAPAPAHPPAPAPKRAKAPARDADDLFVSRAFEHFQKVAQRVGWPVPRDLSQKRKSAILARVTDAGGVAAFCEQIDRAASSPFLRGESSGTRGTPFMASLDFLVRRDTFVKLMEGNYDRNHPSRPQDGGGPARPGPRQAGEGLVEAFASVAAERSGRGD